MTRILIVDDEEIISSSLEIMLKACENFEVVGTAENGQRAYEMALIKKPDIVLMDVFMPVMDGVESTRLIKAVLPETKIIILTTFDDDKYVFSALTYGASGYLLKGISRKELEESIIIVQNGGAMINPSVTKKVISRFSNMMQTSEHIKVNEREVSRLTETERSMIKNVGRGFSNKEISAKMLLGEGTVRNYISAILEKLGLRDRTQLAIFSVQSGFFDGTEEKR